jgi:hypothetical protein
LSDVVVTVAATAGTASAEIDDGVISAWIEGRLNDARNIFIQNVSRGGGPSVGGEYPVTDTGRLVNSVDFQMNGPREGQLDSDVSYAVFLTTGTTKMAKRKMLPEALEEAMERGNADGLREAVKVTVG